MRLGDVVDQFLDENGLAHAGAAEQADLAAACIGREQVDDLDAGDQNLRFGRLVVEVRRRLRGSARLAVASTGPASSTGSPMTFRMRPSVASPTGTEIGAPVSITAWPRTRPSVASMAMVRTVFSPRCWATSSTRRLPAFSVFRRVQNGGQGSFELHVDDGADDLRNATVAGGFFSVAIVVFLAVALERFGARNDFDEFVGDLTAWR